MNESVIERMEVIRRAQYEGLAAFMGRSPALKVEPDRSLGLAVTFVVTWKNESGTEVHTFRGINRSTVVNQWNTFVVNYMRGVYAV